MAADFLSIFGGKIIAGPVYCVVFGYLAFFGYSLFIKLKDEKASSGNNLV
jgi:hypothetical protein